jgi:hypothetical protein
MRTQAKIKYDLMRGEQTNSKGRIEKRGEQTDRREESMVRKGKSKRKRFQRTI